MLEGQHGREKANMHSQKMYLRQTNSLMELDHGRLFFSPKEKVQDPKHSMLSNFN